MIGVRRSRPNAFGRSFTPGGAWRRLSSARSIIDSARSTTSGSKPSATSRWTTGTLAQTAFGQGEAAVLVRSDRRSEWSTVLQSHGQMVVVLEAPDPALSMLVVSGIAYPLVILAAVARVRGERRRPEETKDE